MWVHFEFTNGSRPYIATTNDSIKWMLNHYDCEQIGDMFFRVYGERPKKCKTYRDWKSFFHELAIKWQSSWENIDYDEYRFIGWQEFFYNFGKKYGLLQEFKENGIC